MRDILDLDRYPLDRPDSSEFTTLVADCQRAMTTGGMFNLEGILLPDAIERAVDEIEPLMSSVSFTHRRLHNVYFKDKVDGLEPDHGAMQRFETVHHTVCDDQLQKSVIHQIYEYAPLVAFLARVMGKPRLYLMSDPLARANVMEYRAGETLNWHFDRSVFTVTLLIQPATSGGEFEYRTGLRTDIDPNFDGVAGVLRGDDDRVRVNPLTAGTLNVFAGKNTLHRVSTVRGTKSRLVAVFSYYEQPDVMFSESERVGFYGRAG